MPEEGSFASLLSGDPLPRLPPQDDPEQHKFNSDVVSYLRRLTSRFTSQNMQDIIIVQEGVGSGSEEINMWIPVADPSQRPPGPLSFARLTLVASSEYKCKLTKMTHKTIANNSVQDLFIEVDGFELPGSGVNTTERNVLNVFTFDDNVVNIGDEIVLHLVGAAPDMFYIHLTVGRVAIE